MDVDVGDLVRVIYIVGEGELTLHPSLVPEILCHLNVPQSEVVPLALVSLIPREREVLSLLARGLDIAQELFQRAYLAHIHYEKLNVHSRTEAALMGLSGEATDRTPRLQAPPVDPINADG